MRRKTKKATGPAKKEPQEIVSGNDTGPHLAVERGSVEVDMAAAVPLDPDSQRSRLRLQPQARRVWAPDSLIRGRNPALRSHHHDAATRYFEDFLIGEMEANPNRRIGPSTRTDPWSRVPFNEQRVQRRESWRRANKALGPGLIGIVVWTVLQVTKDAATPPTVEAWAKQQTPRPWGTERAVGLLIAALEVLAYHYGFVKHMTGRKNAADQDLAGG